MNGIADQLREKTRSLYSLTLLSKHVGLFVLFAMTLSYLVKAQAQSITISPGYTNVATNGKIQYSATVSGVANASVTWAISGANVQDGTISSTGLYTAPSVVPSKALVITATTLDKKMMAAVYVNVAGVGPTIKAVSPTLISTGSYVATVTGTNFLPGTKIMVGGSALKTTYVNANTVTVEGWQGVVGIVPFAAENPSTFAGPPFMVTFKSNVPQTVTPANATVNLGASLQFISTGATSWMASSGTISATGLYSPPSAMPNSGAATITATGPNGTGSVNVTLQIPQLIFPVTISVALGGTQQFQSVGAISWKTSTGTISASGLYTAPSGLPGSGIATVTATGPHESVSATVTLVPPTPHISAVGTGQISLGIFTTSITGTGFISTSTAQLNGTLIGSTYTNGALTLTGFYAHPGIANVTVSNGSVISAPFPVQVGISNPLSSPAAARRFLEQAAFGPTPDDSAHVQTVGMKGWLDEQFNLSQISNYNTITASQNGMPAHFLTNAVGNQDQLRQRVAFTLSQIFVTSEDKLIWNANMVPFQNMLLASSFSNFRQVLKNVTLTPAMGQYLDMANNAKANLTTGSVANENYARELLQLFTLGTNLLNQDGSLQLDANGLPIPTYSQSDITEFARVYTGWTYAPTPGTAIRWDGGTYSYTGQMVSYTAQHDFGSKKLLRGYTSPAGATAQQDLDNALDNIFNHPNLGPFLSKQLIQHLVKSNPSASYISRVAAAFNNNGNNVRGDLRATITAVLLDPEARANDEGGKERPDDGHLQEPVLFIVGMVRAFGGQMNEQNYYTHELASMGQDIFDAPSIFNFYMPGYAVPGTQIIGGEFQIYSPNNAIIRANEVQTLFRLTTPIQSYGPGTTVDLTPFVSLASDPAMLVDALDLTLTHGVMPATMKAQIINAISADTGDAVHRVTTGCYLILTSSFYNVWH